VCVSYGAKFGTYFGFDFRVSADTAILDGFLILLSGRTIPLVFGVYKIRRLVGLHFYIATGQTLYHRYTRARNNEYFPIIGIMIHVVSPCSFI
jgi:hypothetical protein